MSDLRELLEVAAGPVGRGLDYAAIVRRARQRRRNTLVAAGVLVATALLVGAVPWLNRSSTLDLDMRRDVTPADERVGTGPTRTETGAGGSDAPVMSAPPDATEPAGFGLPGPAPALAPVDVGAPVPAPIGRVAFTRSGYVYVADLDMTDQEHVATAAHSPAWSPDGSKLAFILLVSYDDPATAPRSGTGHLAIADPDGGSVTVIRDDGRGRGGWSVDSPVWSPDGSRIAFVQRYCDRGLDTTHVGLGTARDDACRPDTPEEEDGGAISWSEIRSIGVDGTGERVLASAPDTYSESPSFSPDGTRIAFARAANVAGAAWDLYVARADGSSGTNITPGLDDGGSAYDPAWSPDGRWIAFTNSSAGPGVACDVRRSAISLISPDGAEKPRVTAGGEGCDSEPAWLADAGGLVFTRRVDENRAAGQLWVVSPPGANGVLIHLGPGLGAAIRPT